MCFIGRDKTQQSACHWNVMTSNRNLLQILEDWSKPKKLQHYYKMSMKVKQTVTFALWKYQEELLQCLARKGKRENWKALQSSDHQPIVLPIYCKPPMPRPTTSGLNHVWLEEISQYHRLLWYWKCALFLSNFSILPVLSKNKFSVVSHCTGSEISSSAMGKITCWCDLVQSLCSLC